MFQGIKKVLNSIKDGFNANEQDGKGIDVALNPVLKFVEKGIKALWNGIKAFYNSCVYGHKRYSGDVDGQAQALESVSAQSSAATNEACEALTAVGELAGALAGVTGRLGYDKVLCPTGAAIRDNVVYPAATAIQNNVLTPGYKHLVERPMNAANSALAGVVPRRLAMLRSGA